MPAPAGVPQQRRSRLRVVLVLQGANVCADGQACRRAPCCDTRQHLLPNAKRAAPASNFSETALNIHVTLAPLIALIAGILILVMPKLLNFIVAAYLIVIGVVGLFGVGGRLLG